MGVRSRNFTFSSIFRIVRRQFIDVLLNPSPDGGLWNLLEANPPMTFLQKVSTACFVVIPCRASCPGRCRIFFVLFTGLGLFFM